MPGPYAPIAHSLGAPATKTSDIPPTSIFLVLFLACFLFALRLEKANKAAHHKFLLLNPLFALSAIRIVSTSMRIASACNHTNISLALATSIFIAAGTVTLYICNVFFVVRIVQAVQPRLGWSRPVSALPWVALAVTVATLLINLTSIIQQTFTRDADILHIDRTIQKVGSLINLFLAVLPLPLLLVTFLLPRTEKAERFGTQGSLAQKVGILAIGAALLTLGAGFRAGTTWMPLVSVREATPWFLSKGCFYVFDLGMDFLVLAGYLASRVDLRFWVPDGSKKAGDFESGVAAREEKMGASATGNGADVERGSVGSDGRASVESVVDEDLEEKEMEKDSDVEA